MRETITLHVNGQDHTLLVDPQTPLLTVLRQDLHLVGPKYGCGSEQCGACKVLVDGQDVPSCQLPVANVVGLPVITVEGLGSAAAPYPLQEAFIAEQAAQCGYCAAGMVIAAQGLLNRVRYPTDAQIREALATNLCRCGVYDRVRRAIKLRIGQPAEPLYTVITPPDEAAPPALLSSRSLQTNPDLDAWLRIDADETVTLFSGKVEIGQGIKTALAQMAAEELNVQPQRIRVVTADTALAPNEGVTAGSMSVQTSGAALRLAAATARRLLQQLAFEELETETAVSQLTIHDGTITDPASGRQTSYWQLMGGKQFGRRVQADAPLKSVAAYETVGTPFARLDIPAKVSGGRSFVQDLDLPQLAHGRVVRPPAYDARLVSVDETAVAALPGVLAVVRDGSFLAVIAERMAQADAAAARLRETAVWHNPTALPTMAEIYQRLRAPGARAALVVDGRAIEGPVPPAPPLTGDRQLTATYFRPYQMHGALSPSAATAQLVDGALTIWSHSQGVPLLPHTVGAVLGMAPADIRVIHAEGSGCYGHNGADDAALDAALLARALPGRPVAVQWSRADEHGWEPYGTAMVMDLAAGLDAQGRITGWRHDVYSFPHTNRPRSGGETSSLLAAAHLADPFPQPQPRAVYGSHFGEYRNADPKYILPDKHIVAHLQTDSPLRTSSLRSLGAYANVFAIESFMDELAHAAGADPLAFRLAHLQDPRARAVLAAVAELSGWAQRQAVMGNGRGYGLAFAQYKNVQTYAAVVVEVAVEDSGEILLKQAWIAADAGQIINPDGLSNQLEGGLMQAASWTLYERVRWQRQAITSLDWDSYPILRFPQAPVIRTVLLNRPQLPPLGCGEAAQGPTPAAIANAVFAATGRRLRTLPLAAET